MDCINAHYPHVLTLVVIVPAVVQIAPDYAQSRHVTYTHGHGSPLEPRKVTGAQLDGVFHIRYRLSSLWMIRKAQFQLKSPKQRQLCSTRTRTVLLLLATHCFTPSTNSSRLPLRSFGPFSIMCCRITFGAKDTRMGRGSTMWPLTGPSPTLSSTITCKETPVSSSHASTRAGRRLL